MHTLSQSPFLQALGYAIANSLWQVALLWIVVVIINSVAKFSSHTRYRIALTAQLAGFAWFIITLKFYYATCSATISSLSELSNENVVIYHPSVSESASSFLSVITNVERVLPYLSIAYLGLLALLSIKCIRSYRSTQLIKTEALHRIDVNWRLFVKKMGNHLGIKNEIKIYLSELVKSPMTIGYLKPVILIPIASINHLTSEQLEAVILHELAHIKRADYLINLIQTIIEIALFFNPFTQLIGRQIKQERENSCDDWVLQFQYNPSMYAEALLRIAYMQTQPLLSMQAAGNKEGNLLSRVKRLLNKQEKIFNYKQQLIALVLMTGILCSVAWLQPSNQLAAKHEKLHIDSAHTVVVEPMAAQVDNPFFNPVFFLSKPLKEELNKASEQAKTELAKSTETFTKATDDLSKVAPAVMDELGKSFNKNFTDEVQRGSDEAMKQIANIKWSSIPGITFLMDTARITASLKNSLAQQKKINWQKINEGIAEANKRLSKLKSDKQLALLRKGNFEVLIDKALSDAFSSIEDMPVWNASDENNEQENFNEKVQDHKVRFRRLQLEKLREQKINVDSIKAFLIEQNKLAEEQHANEIQGYSQYVYTRPLYREVAPPPSPSVAYIPVQPAPAFYTSYRTADDAPAVQENNNDDDQLREEKKQDKKTLQSNEKHCIKITSSNDKRHVTIVIEMNELP